MADLGINEGQKFILTQLPIQRQAEVVQRITHQKYLMDKLEENQAEENQAEENELFDSEGNYLGTGFY